MMLKSMKLLPDASITASDFISQSTEIKGKCKATEEPEGSYSSKKLIEYDDEDKDEDKNDDKDEDEDENENDRSGAGDIETCAMQVTDD